VEVPPIHPDPRSDPQATQATQEISREELEDALRRTKSGTRAVVRPEPKPVLSRPHEDVGPHHDSLPGPRDDEGPEITILRIDSVEFSVIDPASLPPPAAMHIPTPWAASPLHPSITTASAAPRSLPASMTRGLHLTPRLAFLIGVGLVAFVVLVGMVGFLAGRFTGH
jgi:hypothetical protein